MKQIISDTLEQAAELGQTVKKAVVQDLVKGIAQSAKQQLSGASSQGQGASNQDQMQEAGGGTKDKKAGVGNKKTSDPVTGKPTPSKRALTQLTDAANRLQMTKLQKLREELEKQRNKVQDEKGQAVSGQGPEVKTTDKKPDPGAVARTMQQSQSTGELKGSVGG